MVVEEVAIPALYFRTAEIVAGVEIDGRDRALGGDDFFAALVEFVALGVVRRAVRLGEDAVVVGAAPTGQIVAAVAGHEFKKGARVEEVSDPGVTADLVVAGAHGGGLHAGLLVLHRDADAETLVPHLLERFGDQAVGFGGVVEEFEFGETLATREARVGEEFLRGGQIVGEHGAGVESGGVGRREVAGRDLATAEHIAHKALAVDGEREGAADAGIVQRRFLDVEAEEERAEINVRVEERGFFLPVDRDFRDR